MAKIYVNDVVKKSSLQLIYCCTCALIHIASSSCIFQGVEALAEFGVLYKHCTGVAAQGQSPILNPLQKFVSCNYNPPS